MTIQSSEKKLPHAHRDCAGREGVWLPKEHNAPATAAKHPYCVACGTVRSLAWPRAKPLGYFLNGVATLKDYLDRASPRPKLARVHSHLISTRLSVRPEFEDSYGVSGQVQLDAYVRVVQSVRPDLEEELILHLLPGPRGRRRRDAPLGNESPTNA